MKATEQLKKEHGAVKAMLLVLDRICKKLERGEPANISDLENLLEFFSVFVDKCHHVKEEDMLFTALQGSLDPSDAERVGALLKDHVNGRSYIHELTLALAAHKKGDPEAVQAIIQNARNYMTLLIQHIDIEDNVLYPIADKRLSAQAQEEMLLDFDRFEEEEIGAGKHEEFHRMIDRLKSTYLP